MKPTGFHLLFFVVPGLLAAQEPAAPVKTSERLKEEIRANLPPYTPPPQVLDQPHDSGTETDPDLFALPKVTVREKRTPRIESNDLLSRKELNKKFAREYRNSLKGLDSVLNGFTIPILSPSAADRGREAYRHRRTVEIYESAETGRLADAKNSAAIKNEVIQAENARDWQSRPAGDGRKK